MEVSTLVSAVGTFMIGMLTVSLFTGLTVEAIKKLLGDFKKKIPTNILASIVSVVLAIAVSVCYAIIRDIPFDGIYIICIVGLVFVSWLCAMCGYDKVKQTIEQIIAAFKGGK